MKRIWVHLFLIVAAVAVGLTVGCVLAGHVRAKGPNSVSANLDPASAAPRNANGHSPKAAAARLNDDSPLATKLERELSMSSGVTRWLYWLDALEKAAPGDFPRLVRLA